MLSTIELSKLIKRNGGQLLDAFPIEEACQYQHLVRDLKVLDVKDHTLFQQRYVQLYKLRGQGVNVVFLNRYFELMETYKQPHRLELRILASALWGIRPLRALSPVQFRYLTFLANMIVADFPIYNQPIAHLFGFKPPIQSRLDHRERLNIFLRFYQMLQRTYLEVGEGVEVKKVLIACKVKLKSANIELPKQKRLEMLLRVLADLHQKKVLV